MVFKFVSFGACPNLLLLLLCSRAGAQLNRNIQPAAANASKESAAGAELFSSEAIQLTDSVLVGLKDQEDLAQYAPLFTFGNASASHEEPSGPAQDCKTYPGDPKWPSTDSWEVFDGLLGSALSPIIPIASPCYKDSVYDNYDSSLCASVTEGWVEESTQSVLFYLEGGCPL